MASNRQRLALFLKASFARSTSIRMGMMLRSVFMCKTKFCSPITHISARQKRNIRFRRWIIVKSLLQKFLNLKGGRRELSSSAILQKDGGCHARQEGETREQLYPTEQFPALSAVSRRLSMS